MSKQQTTTLQAFSYKGLIPPPDMMEQFKKLDPDLPKKIIELTERSFSVTETELGIYAKDVEVQKSNIELLSKEVDYKAKYDFRNQILVLFIIVSLLGSIILLAYTGYETISAILATGSFLTFITSIIKNKSK
jgi:hypothetical protein